MGNSKKVRRCPSCGHTGTGVFCSQCGEHLEVKQLTIKGLLFDIFHLFTKFEKGFGYTLKQLVIAPGKMQRSYIEGSRKNHQKPFSMFFICGTITALLRFWILNYVMTNYHSADPVEVKFFREYMVLLYILLVPLYSFFTLLFFYRSGYNYIEIVVLMLYTLSAIFLSSSAIFLLLLVWHNMEVVYLEFIIYSVYFAVTFVNFFHTYARWKAALFSILCLAIAFLINQFAEGLAIRILY